MQGRADVIKPEIGEMSVVQCTSSVLPAGADRQAQLRQHCFRVKPVQGMAPGTVHEHPDASAGQQRGGDEQFFHVSSWFGWIV